MFEGMVLLGTGDFGVGEGVSVTPGVGVTVGVAVNVGVGVERIAPATPNLLAANTPPPMIASSTITAPPIKPTRSNVALESPTRPRRFLVHSNGSGCDGI